MTPELKEKWCDALESGLYKQGTQLLYRKGNDTHCCLGVLCRVAQLPYKEEEAAFERCHGYMESNGSR